MEAAVRTRLGKEPRADTPKRWIDRWRAMSAASRAASMALVVVVFPVAYLMQANDGQELDATATSDEPPKGSPVARNASPQAASASIASGSRPTKKAEGTVPAKDSRAVPAIAIPAESLKVELASNAGASITTAHAASDAQAGPSPSAMAGNDPEDIDHSLTGGDGITTGTGLDGESSVAEVSPETSSPGAQLSPIPTSTKQGESLATTTPATAGSAGTNVERGDTPWRGTMRRALSLARGAGDPGERATALAALAGVYADMQDTKAAEDTLAEALQAVTSTDIARDLTAAISTIAKVKNALWAVKALSQTASGEGANGLDAVTPALEAARQIPELHDRAVCLGTIAKHLAWSGQPSHAKAVFTEAFGVARILDSKAASITAVGEIAWDLAEAGDMEAAQELAARMREDAKTIAKAHERVTALGAVAVIASSWEREMAKAQELLSESSRLAEGILDPSERARITDTMTISMIQSLSRGARILTSAGKNDEARAKLEHAAELVGRIKAPGDQVRALASIAEAHVGMRAGQPGARLLDVPGKAEGVAYGVPARATGRDH